MPDDDLIQNVLKHLDLDLLKQIDERIADLEERMLTIAFDFLSHRLKREPTEEEIQQFCDEMNRIVDGAINKKTTN